jgi:hypothetical protein
LRKNRPLSEDWVFSSCAPRPALINGLRAVPDGPHLTPTMSATHTATLWPGRRTIPAAVSVKGTGLDMSHRPSFDN